MNVKPTIKLEVSKACFLNDQIKVSWESKNADSVEIVHNGSISAVQLNGSLFFNATEHETISFIVSNREWSLESEEHKILVYSEDHFQLPHFINVEQIQDKINAHNQMGGFVGHKHYLYPAFIIVSIPLVVGFYSLLGFIAQPISVKLGVLLFSTIWTYSSYKFVSDVVHHTNSRNNILFCTLTMFGIVYLSSIFRIDTIKAPEVEYRLTIWVGAFLGIIYLVSINCLKRVIYGKV